MPEVLFGGIIDVGGCIEPIVLSSQVGSDAPQK